MRHSVFCGISLTRKKVYPHERKDVRTWSYVCTLTSVQTQNDLWWREIKWSVEKILALFAHSWELRLVASRIEQRLLGRHH